MNSHTVNQLIAWGEAHWIVSLLIILAVLSVLEEIGKAVVHSIAGPFSRLCDRRLELSLDIARVRAERTALYREQGRQMAIRDLEARDQAAPRSNPGPCVHRNVKQIRTADGELAGWLCQKLGCEKRLPPDWAVADEDLPAPGAPPPEGWVP